MNPHIAIILPPKEQYSAQYKGAVALCMADFTRHSRYRDNTAILGQTDADFGEINYVRLAAWQRWYWRDSYAYAPACARSNRAQAYTHVEVQNRPLIFRYLARLLPKNIALSLHLHNDPQGMQGLSKPAERTALLRRAAAVYCVSDFIRQRFLDGLDDAGSRVHTVHNGIDTERYRPQEKTLTIVYVGRIIQEKGALPLAEALTLIAPQLPDWQFVVCGVDRLEAVSEYERATHALLSRLGTQCHYTGYIDHEAVMQQFSQAAIAVVPSVWQEPFGRTVLEAMCGGAAVVTSGSGGIAEVIGDAGTRVHPLNAQGLAEALLGLAGNAAQRTDSQQRARARAVAQFDIRRVAAQLDDLRTRLL